jgi:Spy/CpxP family protein refolding chaperone
MRRWIILVGLLTALVPFAHSQGGPPNRKFGKGVLSKLDLSESQRVQIERISKPRIEAIEAIKKKTLSFPERKRQIGEILQVLQTEINAVLTTMQRQQLQKLLDEARRDKWNRRPPIGDPPPQ